VLTEFFDTADPVQTASTLSPQKGFEDTTLTFGKMKMVRGKAFSIGDTTQISPRTGGIPVYKSWLHSDGRTFLVEELPVQKIETKLEQLPAPVSANVVVSSAKSVLHKISTTRLLTPIRLVQASTNTIQLAKADFNLKPGVVLDYDEINSDQTDLHFRATRRI